MKRMLFCLPLLLGACASTHGGAFPAHVRRPASGRRVEGAARERRFSSEAERFAREAEDNFGRQDFDETPSWPMLLLLGVLGAGAALLL